MRGKKPFGVKSWCSPFLSLLIYETVCVCLSVSVCLLDFKNSDQITSHEQKDKKNSPLKSFFLAQLVFFFNLGRLCLMSWDIIGMSYKCTSVYECLSLRVLSWADSIIYRASSVYSFLCHLWPLCQVVLCMSVSLQLCSIKHAASPQQMKHSTPRLIHCQWLISWHL